MLRLVNLDVPALQSTNQFVLSLIRHSLMLVSQDALAKSSRQKDLVQILVHLSEMYSVVATKSNMARPVLVRDAVSGQPSVGRKSTKHANGLEKLSSKDSKPLATGEENPRLPSNVSVALSSKFAPENLLPERTRNAAGLDTSSTPNGSKIVNGNLMVKSERDNTVANKLPCALDPNAHKPDKTVHTRDQSMNYW